LGALKKSKAFCIRVQFKLIGGSSAKKRTKNSKELPIKREELELKNIHGEGGEGENELSRRKKSESGGSAKPWKRHWILRACGIVEGGGIPSS